MLALDSSAILAALPGVNGADCVEDDIEESVISSVIAAAVINEPTDDGTIRDEVHARFQELRLESVPFDENLAIATGCLRSLTSHKGFSLGDRACPALAIREDATAMTADRHWADLDLGCKIEVIR